jgi:hypothetical protein
VQHPVSIARVRPSRSEGRAARIALVLVELIVALGAVYGGVMLLADADELGADPVWLEGSVFSDFTVPGLVLLVVIGGGMLVAATAAALRPSHAGVLAELMAVVLIVWGFVETVTIGWQGTGQLVLVAIFVVLPALLMLLLGSRVRGHG